MSRYAPSAAGSRRATPEAQTPGPATRTMAARRGGHRRPSRRPNIHCRASTRELGHRDDLERVAREERRLLGRGRRQRLPEREVRQVERIAHAEHEEQAPRAAQAGGERQRRPRQPGHEAGGEQEAGRGRAVEASPGAGTAGRRADRRTRARRRRGPAPSPGPSARGRRRCRSRGFGRRALCQPIRRRAPRSGGRRWGVRRSEARWLIADVPAQL